MKKYRSKIILALLVLFVAAGISAFNDRLSGLVAAAPVTAPAPPPAGDVTFDFDGDGKADVGRWRGVATEFKTKKSGSSGYSEYILGSSGAMAAPGDFNGAVEATVDGTQTKFDVDLYNGNGNFAAHLDEFLYNEENQISTHPGDVVRRLNARGVTTGVRCK